MLERVAIHGLIRSAMDGEDRPGGLREIERGEGDVSRDGLLEDGGGNGFSMPSYW